MMMDLLWPGFLWLLALIPTLIGIYIWMLRRRHVAMRYSSLSLVRAALPPASNLRRHLPFALFLFALASLIFALGRPVSIISVPTNQTTIMVALDVSGSMCQADIEPSRLDAAEAAVAEFIENQDSRTRIGLVAFAGFAELIQPPTNDQLVLMAAIDSLLTGRGTAIGSGIQKSIDAIAEIDPTVAPVTTGPVSTIPPTPAPEGAYVPSIIVVLTDGVSTRGDSPLEAAQQAADRGIRVYTIGFGTEQGTAGRIGDCGGRRVDGGGFFGGGFGFGGGGGNFRRGIDEEMLQTIADMTGGEYYSAESGSDLQTIFENLPTYLIVKHEVSEISVLFAALGGLVAAVAIGLSQLWHPLP